MDLVAIQCAKCDAKLGSLPNMWVQIGKRYLTPATSPGAALPAVNITTSGTPRFGDADTLVAGCRLQGADCAKCRTNIGQKCLRTPVNHVLHDGQFILRIASITLKSAKNLRRRAEPKIQRTLKLKNGPPATSDDPSTPMQETPPFNTFNAGAGVPHGLDLMQLQATLDAQRRDINRIGATGMQVVTNFETAIVKVDRQMQQLSDSIDSVRRGGNGHHDDISGLKSDLSDLQWDCQNSGSVLSRLDQQLQTTDRVVTELRQALSKCKSDTQDVRDQLATTQQELQDVGSLQDQLASVQQDLQGVEGLREQLVSTQQDLQESREEVDRLRNEAQDAKHELRESKDDMNRLRSEVDETKQAALEGIATSKEYASEVSSLRREIKQLRADLARDRPDPPPPTPSKMPFSSHELDILTSSISKIGNRASQIESLQMEFDLFRTRIQRLEARSTMTSVTPEGATTAGSNASPGRNDENLQSSSVDQSHKKRALMSRIGTHNVDTAPLNRVALSSPGFDIAISTAHAQPSDLYRSPPAARGLAEPAGRRRTRAAASLNGARKRRL
ncbi:hypothetical protein Purlil1_13107 [Purpureocillium lilacinum]|uniref:Spc7 kinetochore protein domain-containing protein n=1 Tax=Purpureocillium lilacinum TaxID=33203 RepID=A0ABR0BFD1_PURLI|nr:hypothetical protein Purlil1_13107 [Purpureocillium lilacinum]